MIKRELLQQFRLFWRIILHGITDNSAEDGSVIIGNTKRAQANELTNFEDWIDIFED